MIGRSAIAGKTSFLYKSYYFVISSYLNAYSQKKQNIQSKRRGKETERLF